MKKSLVLVLFSIFAFSIFSIKAEAANPISVYIDAKKVNFDVNPFIEKGVTLVEFRTLFDTLNISFEYISKSNIIKANHNGNKIQIQIGSKTAYINGKQVVLQVPAKIVNGRTMIPLRFFGESTGSNVAWHDGPREIDIYSKDYKGDKREVSSSLTALRGLKWDMSMQEVRNIEKAKYIFSSSSEYIHVLQYSTRAYGYDAVLSYLFENGKLSAVTYNFLLDDDEMVYMHHVLEERVAKEFGNGVFIGDSDGLPMTGWEHPSQGILLFSYDSGVYTGIGLTFLKKGGL